MFKKGMKVAKHQGSLVEAAAGDANQETIQSIKVVSEPGAAEKLTAVYTLDTRYVSWRHLVTAKGEVKRTEQA